jgi:hypothetical protein
MLLSFRFVIMASENAERAFVPVILVKELLEELDTILQEMTVLQVRI